MADKLNLEKLDDDTKRDLSILILRTLPDEVLGAFVSKQIGNVTGPAIEQGRFRAVLHALATVLGAGCCLAAKETDQTLDEIVQEVRDTLDSAMDESVKELELPRDKIKRRGT